MRKNKEEELQKLIDQYQITNQEEVPSKNKFINSVTINYRLKNGFSLTREKLVKNGGNSSAVAVLPITNQEEVCLIVQPRPVTKKNVCLEIPAGYIDDNETKEQAVIRELKEETGLIAKKEDLVYVTTYIQDTGISDAEVSVYLAFNCQETNEVSFDEDEIVSKFKVTIEEAFELLENNRLDGASTQLALSLGKERIKKYYGNGSK